MTPAQSLIVAAARVADDAQKTEYGPPSALAIRDPRSAIRDGRQDHNGRERQQTPTPGGRASPH
jgi:hypothetical protein